MVRFPWGFRLYFRFAYSYLYDAHTRTYMMIIIYISYYVRRTVRAVPECTQIMSGGRRKQHRVQIAPVGRHHVLHRDRVTGNLTLSAAAAAHHRRVLFTPFFLFATGCTKLPGLDRVRDLRGSPARDTQ